MKPIIKQDNTTVSNPPLINPIIRLLRQGEAYINDLSKKIIVRNNNLLLQPDYRTPSDKIKALRKFNEREKLLEEAKLLKALSGFFTFIAPSTYIGPVFNSNGKSYTENVMSGEGTGNTEANIAIDVLAPLAASKIGTLTTKGLKVYNTYKLGRLLNKAANAFDGTVGTSYFRSPSNWYRITESPEIISLLELGMNLTTRDINPAISPVEEFRLFVLDKKLRSGTGENEGYWIIPRRRTISLSKHGQAHGNTSQAAKGEIWTGTYAKSKLFPGYVIEGLGPAETFRGFNPKTNTDSRTNFVKVPWDDIPIGARIGFHSGEMPMEGLRAFRWLSNGRYRYEGPILPNKTRFRLGDVEINDPSSNYRQLRIGGADRFARTGNLFAPSYLDEDYIEQLQETLPFKEWLKTPYAWYHGEYSNPMYARGRLWYGSSDKVLSSNPDLLVTREPMFVANLRAKKIAGNVDDLSEVRRIPVKTLSINISNTGAYYYDPGYGFRRITLENPKMVFYQRPSKLTLAEKSGMTKHDRTNKSN